MGWPPLRRLLWRAPFKVWKLTFVLGAKQQAGFAVGALDSTKATSLFEAYFW